MHARFRAWIPILLIAPTMAFAQEKHRIVVMTDIGGDPDDIQSMVRYMLYTCDLDTEGLLTGLGWGHDHTTHPELIRQCVEAYQEVYLNLKKHREGYPTPDTLLGLIKDGYQKDKDKVGPGMNSEASDWIIQVVDKPDPRPVWFAVWGGPRELAQAIWKVSQTRSKEEAATFKKKIRVHSIADQDKTAEWVKKNHPDVVWLYSKHLYRGIWNSGNQDLVSPAWLKENVRTFHGPLGAIYPAKAAGKIGVKEGDTPSFFYILPDGLSNPNHPGWGNWGGRFKSSGHGQEYLPAKDLHRGHPDMLYTIHRWREAYQNEFEARMDWCVKMPDQANHQPRARLNGNTGIKVLKLTADPGSEITLDASGSTDSDGHELTLHWWIYEEAGSYWDSPNITELKTKAMVTIPEDASGHTIHVILEVTDNGKPPLTAYRRVVIQVSGTPVAGARPDPDRPVTRLEGPGKG